MDDSIKDKIRNNNKEENTETEKKILKAVRGRGLIPEEEKTFYSFLDATIDVEEIEKSKRDMFSFHASVFPLLPGPRLFEEVEESVEPQESESHAETQISGTRFVPLWSIKKVKTKDNIPCRVLVWEDESGLFSRWEKWRKINAGIFEVDVYDRKKGSMNFIVKEFTEFQDMDGALIKTAIKVWEDKNTREVFTTIKRGLKRGRFYFSLGNGGK